MNWTSKNQIARHFPKAMPLLLLLLAGVLFLGLCGCAQNGKELKPIPLMPKAEGLSIAGKFRAVVIEDMDNDGNLDIVGGASSPGMVTINYGDGQGGVSKPQPLYVVGDVRSVAVADVNEDGLADIIYSVQKESSGIKVFLNQSKHDWKPGKSPIEINRYEGLKTADVNGDGHLDIIAANVTSATQGGIQVWLGDGNGGWPVETGPTISGQYMDVLVADFNHDGNPDIAGSGWGIHGALRVWLGDGTGNWRSTNPVEKGSFFGLSVADFNQDGHFDILAGSNRNGVRIFLGDGRGAFEKILSPVEAMNRRAKGHKGTATGVGEFPRPPKDRSYWHVMALDLDQDGLQDIIAGSLDSEGIKAWRNLGKKGWKSLDDAWPSNGTFYGMAVADIDQDEKADLCAASYGEGIKIWAGKKSAVKIVQQYIARQKSKDPFNRLIVPLENDVYKTIDGIEEYKFGAGDTLEITFWEGSEAKREEILVRSNGTISFGFVEDLPVKGLTATELDRNLTRNLEEYVKNPRIDVVVKKYNSKFVQIVGAIQSHGIGTGPGRYKLQGKSTVLEMIAQAGGPNSRANLNDVRIRRESGQTVTVNLYKTINQGDLTQNPIVNSGDTVFVPNLADEGNRVYVFGEVEKPGAYPYSGSNFRLFDAISEAGGATVFASTEKTRIVRGDPTHPEFINADLQRLIENGDQSQNMLLASGDLVYVPRNGWGNVNILNERIRPLFELLLWPARTVIDWYNATDIVSSGRVR